MIITLEISHNSSYVYSVKQCKALQQYENHAKMIYNLDPPIQKIYVDPV